MALVVSLAAYVLAITVFWRVFLRHHLQGDFTGLWGAGRLEGEGRDPYLDPLYVDGTYFARSHYNYGPLVAAVFRPLGALRYETARRLWTGVQAAALVLLLWLAFESLTTALVVATVLVALSPLLVFPLFAHFERGQIDLVIAVGAFASFALWERGAGLAAGAVLTACAALKLPAVLLFVVPLAARDLPFLAGGALAGTIVTALALLVEGPARVGRYFAVILPALDSGHGELPAGLYPHPPPTFPMHEWNGRTFRITQFDAGMASVTRYVQRRTGPTVAKVVGAAGMLVTFSAIAVAFARSPDDANARCLGWLAGVVAMLAFQPNTWIMGGVHLIPVAALLPCFGRAGGVPAIAFTTLALIIVGLGDAVARRPRVLRGARPLIGLSLLWGELIVLLALTGEAAPTGSP